MKLFNWPNVSANLIIVKKKNMLFINEEIVLFFLNFVFEIKQEF